MAEDLPTTGADKAATGAGSNSAPATTAKTETQNTPAQKAAVETIPAVAARPTAFDPRTGAMEGILLPKKETGPSPLSASRVNAAAVLESEAAPMQQSAPAIPEMPKAPLSSEQKQAAMGIRALHTFKSDIEETVRDKNISLVDIAAAQARRGVVSAQTAGEEAKKKFPLRRLLQIGGGIVLLAAAAGIIFAVASRTTSVPAIPAPSAAFITVDDTTVIPTQTGYTRSTLMQALEREREGTGLAIGLISRLYITAPATTSAQSKVPSVPMELTAQELLSIIAPDAPVELSRALAPHYLLGIHAFDGNQALLMFKTDNYGQAFAAMLAWENSMKPGLSPLFDRTPTAHIPEEGTTAVAVGPQLLSTPFVDRVVENHDARVIQNSAGDILLMWTFIDRQTLVITTNEYTLREIISRLTTAPVIPVPGQ